MLLIHLAIHVADRGGSSIPVIKWPLKTYLLTYLGVEVPFLFAEKLAHEIPQAHLPVYYLSCVVNIAMKVFFWPPAAA